MPAIGDEFAGYVLEEIAGTGDRAVVYRARHPSVGGRVAIKVFAQHAADQADLARRLAAGRRTSALGHPHLVRVFDSGLEDGRAYLVMQLVEGPSLRTLLDDSRRLDPARAALVVSQVAGALDAIHAAGLVHRSVSPAKILLEPDLNHPHAYLSDFSLSRDQLGDRLTNVGILLGASAYFSPEAVIGMREVDARSDVYALGCILFELLTGAPPFASRTLAESLFRRTSEPPPLVGAAAPELGTVWNEVVQRALATDPDDRYATAGEFGAAALATAATADPA